MKNKAYIFMAFILGILVVLSFNTVFATDDPAPTPVICQCTCVCCPNLPAPGPKPIVPKPVINNTNTNTNIITVIVNAPETPLAPIIIDKSHDNYHPKNDTKINNHPNIHGDGNTANNVNNINQKNKK